MGWFGECMSRFWNLDKVDYVTRSCYRTLIVNITDSEAKERVTTWLRSDLESICPDFEVWAKLSTWLWAVFECIYWILRIRKLQKGWLHVIKCFWYKNNNGQICMQICCAIFFKSLRKFWKYIAIISYPTHSSKINSLQNQTKHNTKDSDYLFPLL